MYKNSNQVRMDISLKIYSNIIKLIHDIFSKEYNIFLIGASLDDLGSMRSKLNRLLSDKSKIKLHYPEKIFIDQIFQKEYDMLSLENLLASSVDAVVMCVESAGSIAELGAFSNHEKLSNKLIVLMNKEYENKESFINLGPIKYLKNKTKSEVIWIDYDKEIDNPESFYLKLMERLKKIKKESSLLLDFNNPLVIEKYLLALLYALECCSRKELVQFLKNIGTYYDKKEGEIQKYITILDSSLGLLSSNKEIYLESKEFYLSIAGKQRLEREFGKKFIYQNMDNYRLKVLNYELRKFWGS